MPKLIKIHSTLGKIPIVAESSNEDYFEDPKPFPIYESFLIKISNANTQ